MKATSYQTVQVRNIAETLIISLHGSTPLNPISGQMLEELDEIIQAFEGDAAYKGAIIIGNGSKAFAAGADLSELRDFTPEAATSFSQKGQAVFARIENCSKLIIAAVNGYAIGGGCELAMSCHLRVAAEQAIFGQPEVNIGLICGSGGTQRLRDLVGRAKAIEMLVTGEPISAAHALQFGLVNEIATTEKLLDRCLALLQKTYKKSQTAIQLTLATIAEGINTSLLKGYQLEAQNFGRAFAVDGKEGINAFLDKRTPAFC